MNTEIERDCPVCGAHYKANATRLRFGRQTTCSRSCSYKLRAGKLNTSEEHKCGGCGRVVRRCPAHIKSRHGEVFCSRACAYANRKRVVEKPYNLVAVVDYSANSRKAWVTRRANGKPYPDAARAKARARATKRINEGFRVSKFERKAAEVFRVLGFRVLQSVTVRDRRGRWAFVFDICIPSRRLMIECHGNYWHGGRWTWTAADAAQLRNLSREPKKFAVARRAGYDVRILWEQEFRSDPCGAALAAAR